MNAADIARALGGHRSGDGHLVRCPVPGHGQGKGDRRPSLLIRDGERRLLAHCFAGCDPRDIIAALRRRGLLDEDPRRSERRVALSVSGPTLPPAPTVPSLAVQRVWRTADPITGSIAERYLTVHRSLCGPFPPSLRFAPEVFHPRLRRRLPALLAAVQDGDRRVVAVQATWLSTDGCKALPDMPRWTFGTIGNGAVRLGAASERLGLAEGVEDALAVSQLSQLSQGAPPELSCWACLGAARMHRVRIPDTVSEIHIFADDDGPGLNAANRTARAHQAAGRRVAVRLPPPGVKDRGELVRPTSKRTAA
jgi:putative DNA primase/helicase